MPEGEWWEDKEIENRLEWLLNVETRKQVIAARRDGKKQSEIAEILGIENGSFTSDLSVVRHVVRELSDGTA